MQRPVIFGEVLFDCLPDGAQMLGGAPFNVAWNLQSFGLSPLFISKVGKDELGQKILDAMNGHRMDVSCIQQDNSRPTGTVEVSLTDGEPSYEIVNDVAYDYIDADDLRVNVGEGVLYHGSLALRNIQSKTAYKKIKKRLNIPVFVDVNLRAPWYEINTVREMVKDATWCKLNEGELSELKSNLSDSDEIKANKIFFQKQLKSMYLTKGDAGATVLNDKGADYNVVPSCSTKVVDSIGAGDAFCSVIILGLFKDWDIKTTFDRAQEFASAVVGIKGAVSSDEKFYEDFKVAWNI